MGNGNIKITCRPIDITIPIEVQIRLQSHMTSNKPCYRIQDTLAPGWETKDLFYSSADHNEAIWWGVTDKGHRKTLSLKYASSKACLVYRSN